MFDGSLLCLLRGKANFPHASGLAGLPVEEQAAMQHLPCLREVPLQRLPRRRPIQAAHEDGELLRALAPAGALLAVGPAVLPFARGDTELADADPPAVELQAVCLADGAAPDLLREETDLGGPTRLTRLLVENDAAIADLPEPSEVPHQCLFGSRPVQAAHEDWELLDLGSVAFGSPLRCLYLSRGIELPHDDPLSVEHGTIPLVDRPLLFIRCGERHLPDALRLPGLPVEHDAARGHLSDVREVPLKVLPRGASVKSRHEDSELLLSDASVRRRRGSGPEATSCAVVGRGGRSASVRRRSAELADTDPPSVEHGAMQLRDCPLPGCLCAEGHLGSPPGLSSLPVQDESAMGHLTNVGKVPL
mmetsp:Transcript_114180/g.295689  ORF Transcript_114180/g.295689 Transcript_114180/m.295689 type:complete len:362 (-) Transcript_114180:448-1533(-)